jgi:hypothetical protein
LAAAPPGAGLKLGKSAKLTPLSVGTKSTSRSPKQSTSAIVSLRHPERCLRTPILGQEGTRPDQALASPAQLRAEIITPYQLQHYQDHPAGGRFPFMMPTDLPGGSIGACPSSGRGFSFVLK